jgi:hypothetical protein
MLRRDKILRQVLREQFIATLRDGQTFDGLLVEADDKTFRFVNAFAIDGKNRAPVDGELFLPRSEVLYLQKPGGVA